MERDPARASLAFDYCTISGRFDTAPQFHRSSFAGLSEYLQSHVRMITETREEYLNYSKAGQAQMKDGPAIILAKFMPNTKRADDNVEHTTGIGLDIDEAHIELADLKAKLEGHAAIIYETANSTTDARRWRALIPYTIPATPAQHAQAFEYWRGRIHGVGAQSRNPSRLWYGVAQFAKSSRRIFEVVTGKAFDPGTLGRPSPREAFMRRIKSPVGAPASEGGRNNALNEFGTSILSECQTYEDFLDRCAEVNQTYLPPLPIDEVIDYCDRKWKVRQKFGWVDLHTPAGYTHNEDERSIGIDAATLFDTDYGEVPWLVDGMLTYGAHLLVGRPKCGKSWLTLDLALCVASGQPFMGLPVRKCDVLWIASEDTPASLSRRLKARGERPTGNVTIYTTDDVAAERKLWDDCTFDQWVRAYLNEHPSTGLVIIDTHKTCEARWANEQIDQKRHASVVDIAYQSVRLYDDAGQATQTCIVLVHHTAKKKNASVNADPHESINMPNTTLAAATASLVIDDLPDHDPNDDSDMQRRFSLRGRHIINDQKLLVEIVGARIRNHGKYSLHVQSKAQAEVFEAIEVLLGESPTTTIAAVASFMHKHRNTVQTALGRAAKQPGGMTWKGRRLVLKPKVGLYWDDTALR